MNLDTLLSKGFKMRIKELLQVLKNKGDVNVKVVVDLELLAAYLNEIKIVEDGDMTVEAPNDTREFAVTFYKEPKKDGLDGLSGFQPLGDQILTKIF